MDHPYGRKRRLDRVVLCGLVAGDVGPPLSPPDGFTVSRSSASWLGRHRPGEVAPDRSTRDHRRCGLRAALLRDTLAAVAPIDAQKAVLYTPRDGAGEIQRMTPFDALFLAQRGATLGERMSHGVSDLLARGFGRSCWLAPTFRRCLRRS